MNKMYLSLIVLFSSQLAFADINISAPQISQDFNNNSIAAQKRYKGQTIKITGNVSNIWVDYDEQPIVDLYGKNLFEGVELMVSKDDGYLLNISKDDYIEAVCHSANRGIISVKLQDCIIIHYSKPEVTHMQK
ncbi:OB-fold protein [Serratia rhizosphaerae]